MDMRCCRFKKTIERLSNVVFIFFYIPMLNKEELADIAQDWFNCDRKQAELFAEDVLKNNTIKRWRTEWRPTLLMFIVLVIYLIFHR